MQVLKLDVNPNSFLTRKSATPDLIDAMSATIRSFGSFDITLYVLLVSI
jgi:hypothetical protein